MARSRDGVPRRVAVDVIVEIGVHLAPCLGRRMQPLRPQAQGRLRVAVPVMAAGPVSAQMTSGAVSTQGDGAS